MLRALAVCLATGAVGPIVPARAATTSPPMLDITRQCDATSRRNVRAMSECVVAESEARAEILSKWDHVSDANADRCVRPGGGKPGKAGRKAQKLTYVAIATCLTSEPPPPVAPIVAPIVPGPAAATAGEKPSEGISSAAFSKWKQFFSSSPK